MDKRFLTQFTKQMNQNNSEFIRISDLKNRFLYPYFPTIVVDEFYEDPDLWREFALDQTFFKGDRGNWPGLRTDLLHLINRDLFEVTLKKLLFVLKQYGITKVSSLETGFQLIDETYGRGWVHDDDPSFQVAGIIYLNEDAPLNSGTSLYEDCDDFDGETYAKLFAEDVVNASPEERKQFIKYRNEQVSHFTQTIEVGNVYNRCVIFDSRHWHSADNFFGNSTEDTRLTQVFFIKAS
jgi:hypothetical protein